MATAPDKFEVYRQIVEKAWSDPEFKQRLIDDPKKVLQEYGIHTRGEDIEVVQDSGSVFFLPDGPGGFIC